jgi:hypothetical protein
MTFIGKRPHRNAPITAEGPSSQENEPMCDRATLPPTAPVSWQTCTRSFPGHPGQIGRARALLNDFLDGYPAADDAALLVSELCTNAVIHSASGQPGGTFTVRAHLSGTYLHAEVEDQGGSTWDGCLSGAGAPHGLFLLRTLSAACGTLPGAHGWVTWFTLAPGPGT